MLHLDHLNDPLDIAQPASPEFRMQGRVGTAWQPLGLHAGLEAPDLAHLVIADPTGRVPKPVDEFEERSAERLVSGGEVCSQQGLGLPAGGPAFVVGPVRIQRADERALLALGPQIGIDIERRVLRRRHEQAPELIGDRERRGVGRLLVSAIEWLVYEHDIDIAAEAELVPAEPAHADDREPHRKGPARRGLDHADRHLEGRSHRGTRDIAQ
ncbi:unannotated protein [freshwater metagenome]|uniref:Unannotated protein n=1 Tax=freshwater metagenome TaxID=449393 RepID=A0A6J7J1G3_9ZZZZ